MIKNQLAGKTDLEIERAVADANLPTLLIAVAQITEDFTLLEGDMRSTGLPSRDDVDGLRYMDADRQEQIRTHAVHVLVQLRDGQIAMPPLATNAQFEKLASVLVGESVSSEYIPMLIEDMGFTETATSRVQWQQEPQSQDNFKVAIIGSGLSGICAGIYLKQAGIDFTIIEKNKDIGGTWYENTYPACGVDTPNHFYSYSFAPNPNWSGFYSKQQEIHAYIESVVDQYNLRPHIRFNTQATRMQYNNKTCTWQLDTTNLVSNSASHESVNVVLSAVGQLNQPKTPDFPGQKTFTGPAFHSARWEKHDLQGKRVAVIGSGASAMQFAPEIAAEVEQLTIFQRSRHWIRVLPDYHRKVGAHKNLLLECVPFYQNWYRFKLFWSYGDGIWNSIHKDPDWPHPDRSLNAENEKHRQIFTAQLEAAVGGNKEILELLTPDYPPFAKRMLIDNHWCDMLQRDNVQVVEHGIGEITSHGLVDDQGAAHEFDVIIYATGFHAHKFLWPLEVLDNDGNSLEDTWGDDARAYLGMTTPLAPNLFFFYGPNSNLGHGGSLIFHIECQARYITQTLMRMREADKDEIIVRKDVHDEYNATVDAEHNAMVWTHGGVNNWYKNSKGRVVSNSPWRLVDYWHMTHTPKMEDFKVR